VVEGDFAVVGGDLADVAVEVVTRLLSGGGEMVTLVTGNPEMAGHGAASPDVDELVRRVTIHAQELRPNVDVLVYAGGQERYPLLIGVE